MENRFYAIADLLFDQASKLSDMHVFGYRM